MWQHWYWIFAHHTIPSKTWSQSMDDEQISLKIILIMWIKIKIHKEWYECGILRSFHHIPHHFRISIRIDEWIIVDFIVWCPKFRKSNQIIFRCFDANLLDIYLDIGIESSCTHLIKKHIFQCGIYLWMSWSNTLLDIRTNIRVFKRKKSWKKNFTKQEWYIVLYSFFLLLDSSKQQYNMCNESEMIQWSDLPKSRKSIPSIDRKSWKDALSEWIRLSRHTQIIEKKIFLQCWVLFPRHSNHYPRYSEHHTNKPQSHHNSLFLPSYSFEMMMKWCNTEYFFPISEFFALHLDYHRNCLKNEDTTHHHKCK